MSLNLNLNSNWNCPHCGNSNELIFKFCHQCGTQQPDQIFSTESQTFDIAPVQPKKKRRWLPWLFVGIILYVLFIVAVCSIKKETSTVKTSSPASSPSMPMIPEENWQYMNDVDSMTGKSAKQASVKSTNTLFFHSPYQGAQHATLTLRKHPRYGNDVILQIQRGQFMAHIDGCEVIVRFDDNPPMKFWAYGPEDNSTESLFIKNYPKFITQLRKVKRVRISTTVYQEGEPMMEFNVEGLKWN